MGKGIGVRLFILLIGLACFFSFTISHGRLMSKTAPIGFACLLLVLFLTAKDKE